MRRPLSTAALLALNAYWVGLSFMWNALHPIVLPALLASLVAEDRKNTQLGLLTFAGLLIAIVLQPVSGAVSDRWISRHGRRRPLMVIGTALDAVFLLMLGWGGGILWVWLGYLGLQISSNSAQGPLQGLLRDRVPTAQLGVASSMKVFFDLASLVLASLIIGHLMGKGSSGILTVNLVILGLLWACAAITILLGREEPTSFAGLDPKARAQTTEMVIDDRASGYAWVIAERGTFLLGVYGLQAFGQYYLQDALKVPNPPQQAGNLLAVIGLGTIILAVVGGRLSDRLGPKRVLYVASALAGSGMILMLLPRDIRDLYLVGSIVGAGIGLFMTANWALANRLAPRAAAGRFLGMTNLATAGAAALSRLQGPAVDLLNSSHPEAWLGYKGIFIFGAFCIVLSTWFLSRIRVGDSGPTATHGVEPPRVR